VDSIEPNAHVVLEYELCDESGAVVDASDREDGEPIVYVHGYGMIVPGLEAGVAGMKVGDEREVVVPPEAGFGEHDDELVLEVDREDLPRPKEVKTGDEMVAESPDGEEAVMRVVEVKDDSVVLDANHPLAGKTLRYKVKVREIREGTEGEIAEAARGFEEAGYSAGDSDSRREDLVQLTRAPRVPGPTKSQKK
jgi:FKBP-type peptidyl-prolyl cis-trans isomerase SlyD